MEKQTLEYYDWSDVEEFLCEEMGIDQKHFRDYRSVVGGSYKDFWHVWISITDVRNDSYSYVYLEDIDDIMESIIEEHGDWVEVLRGPLTKLGEVYGDEDKCVMIHYYW